MLIKAKCVNFFTPTLRFLGFHPVPPKSEAKMDILGNLTGRKNEMETFNFRFFPLFSVSVEEPRAREMQWLGSKCIPST